MRRTEVHNYTPEQVNDHIEQAIVLLDAHELTADERAQLLPHVFVMLGGKQIVMEQIGPMSGLALPPNAGH
jgi:hypothetical protein